MRTFVGDKMQPSADASELYSFSHDVSWLSENLDKLRPKYENKFVLVKNRQVVLSSANYDSLLSEAESRNIDLSKSVIELILPKNIQLLL